MGMTIKSALEYLKDFDSYTPYQEAINKVSDWIELFQVNYEDRLKADMVAMLEDLDLQIDELAAYNREYAKIQRLIRDRINKLKENKDAI